MSHQPKFEVEQFDPLMAKFYPLIRDLEACAWATGDATMGDAEHNKRWGNRYVAREDLTNAISEVVNDGGALADAVLRYARHDRECPYPDHDCSCGLAPIIASLLGEA